MKKLVKIYMDDDTIDDLKMVGMLEGCTVSFIVRTIIKDYMDFYLYKKQINKEDMDEVSKNINV